MRYFRSFFSRLRRLWRIRAAKADLTPLREFVYLDETSVYSLLASRQGPLPSEYTHTQSSSTTGSLNSSVGFHGGPANAGVSSKAESTQSESTQVLRKSSVQTAFRDLVKGEEGKLALAPIKDRHERPRMAGLADIVAAADSARHGSWIIGADRLSRGHLAEVEVEIRASQIYRFLTIFTTIEDIVNDSPALFPGSLPTELANFKGVGDVLRRMLIGLIPIKCKVVNYKLIETQGKKIIVHVDILRQLTLGSSVREYDLYIAGVTEETLYWKDVRRVLFTGAEYRMLCRFNHDGIRDSWMPVKLVDLLKDIDPTIADQIAQLDKGLMTQSATMAVGHEAIERLKAAVFDFGILLSSEYGHTLSGPQLLSGLPDSRSMQIDISNIDSRRALFQVMTDNVVRELQMSVSAATVARLREYALNRAGLNLDGSIIGASPPTTQLHPSEEAVIDCEVVAIYW